MTDKSAFTAQEWATIRTSALAAGMAVSLAEPSGLIGMFQEGVASAKDMLAAKNDPNGSSLVKAIIAELETSEGRTEARAGLKASITGGTPAEAKAAALAAVAQAARLVEAKAPADAAAFKAWLGAVSRHVAEAASEGGFLGFGGVQVTEAEKATLADIDAALA